MLQSEHRLPSPWTIQEREEFFIVHWGRRSATYILVVTIGAVAASLRGGSEKLTMTRYSANTLDDVQKLLVGYRDNLRVEIEPGVDVTAKTIADLRALQSWPSGLILDIHIDLDPRFSVAKVERVS